MEFFKKQTNIDFLGIRKWSWLLSAILVVASIASVAIKGLNWDLDFTGGYALEVHYPATANLDTIRSQLAQAGITHADAITFGSTKDVMIRMSPKQNVLNDANLAGKNAQDKLASLVQQALGSSASLVQINYTGPEVGAELAQTGMLAMLIAVLATMVYIGLRFELKFAVSAAIALAHDPIIILGVFSLFEIRFDLTALAAVLAVIGYSLNDTVVVYDRIRENFRKMRKAEVVEVVNRAINDTLSRTTMTSGLTLIVVVVLYLFGGPSIHNFALALIIGIVVGTYSSIYVAGALAVAFGLNREALLPSEKKVDDLP